MSPKVKQATTKIASIAESIRDGTANLECNRVDSQQFARAIARMPQFARAIEMVLRFANVIAMNTACRKAITMIPGNSQQQLHGCRDS